MTTKTPRPKPAKTKMNSQIAPATTTVTAKRLMPHQSRPKKTSKTRPKPKSAWTTKLTPRWAKKPKCQMARHRLSHLRQCLCRMLTQITVCFRQTLTKKSAPKIWLKQWNLSAYAPISISSWNRLKAPCPVWPTSCNAACKPNKTGRGNSTLKKAFLMLAVWPVLLHHRQRRCLLSARKTLTFAIRL